MIEKHLKVQFVYEQHQQEKNQVLKPDNERINSEIKMLPKEICIELKKAADEIDYDAVMKIIEQIREQNKFLANALIKLLNSYRFDTLKKLFED